VRGRTPARSAATLWLSLILVAATALGLAAQQPRADLILVNGRVLTVDANDRVAQAVGIAGSRIVAVGSTADVERAAAPNARRIDLRGRAVTPGLLDAHAHFSAGGTSRLFVLDLSYPGVKNMADVAAAIAAKVGTVQRGAWIEGRGWDEGKLAERRVITAKDIDTASPDNPVILTQTTGHYAVVNSAALRLAGVTRETRDPPSGTIDRNPDGTPTGLLREGAVELVRRLVPPRSAAETEAGIRDFVKAFNAEGMTGLKDPGISTATWNIYKKVEQDSALNVRVFVLWSGGRSVDAAKRVIAEHAATTKPYESTGDDHLVAGGVKLYIDGSGGARTAWLYNDWNKDYRGVDTGNRGYPASNADTIRMMIRMYHDAGMHVAVHSIGDRGIDWVVDTYDRAMRENPKKGLRHAIIHSNIPTDHAIDVMARLQRDFDAGYPEPSATFTWWIGDTYAGNFGPQRSLRLNPFRTFRAKGMTWGNGSDYPVTPFAARYGLWAAIAREPLLGVYGKDPFGRAESVDVHDALRAVTIWAAREMFLEKKIGSIEVGKYADLAVWDRDFYSAPTAQIKDAKCLLTLFDGKVVFDAGELR
jgi:predicted amidohydrolase YtcJ